MNTLIVGGMSGLGRELGLLLLKRGDVYVTGRTARDAGKMKFCEFNIGAPTGALRANINILVASLPPIDLVVYAAGFYEHGHIDDLGEEHILTMLNVGLTAPMLLMQNLLRKQKRVEGFIAITSTSQWKPREYEPVYTAAKAGLAKFADSFSLDWRVGKTLVVAPAGMASDFWEDTERDTTGLLPPAWVAEQTLELWDDAFTYRLVRILRDPYRVEVVETRTGTASNGGSFYLSLAVVEWV